MALNAAKGQARSQRLFTDLLKTTEANMVAARNEGLEAAIQYEARWERELERRPKQRIDAPDPIPHPDDIIIDFKNNYAVVGGPMTKEGKEALDANLEPVKECYKTLSELEAKLEDPENHEKRAAIESEYDEQRRRLTEILDTLE